MIRADGTGDAVPLALYPAGFDLSGFTIWDPTTGQTMSGSAVSRSLILASGSGVPSPQDGGGSGDSGPGPTLETGFYEVVRDGVHLWGITNGTTLSGVLTIPVEAANDSGTLVNLSLVENGSPVSDVSIDMPPITAPLQVAMDTTQMTNGVHEIFAHAVWRVTTGTNEGDTYLVEADSTPVTVNVFNEISFPNWISSFGELGNSLLISAQSAHSDTDWNVDIYGANAGYIGRFSGHTTNGTIYGYWDLVGPPPNYVLYTNEPWFQFEVSTPYADPPSPKTYKQTDPWIGPGDWVIAAQHAWDNVVGGDDLYNELDGYITLAQGSGLTVRPAPDSNHHAFALNVGEQSDPIPTANWAAFRQALYDPHSRNFLYMGHGSGEGLGINPDHTNRFISATEIASVLHTIPAGQTNRHAFRMVILDGCSTASGTLPEAFGMSHKENVPEIDFYNASMRPTAFVGWSADKYIAILSGGMNYDHIHFIQHVAYGLTTGRGIQAAIDYAAGQADVNDAYVHHKEFKVYGDPLLTFWAYNN